jgi:hypothetical protein
MAKLYGKMKNEKGSEYIKCGKSFLRTECNTWNIGVTCELTENNGVESIYIYRTNGSTDDGVKIIIGIYEFSNNTKKYVSIEK